MTDRVAPGSAWLFPALMALLGAALGLVAVLNPMIAVGAAVAVAFVGLMLADLTVGVALFAFVAFLEVVPGLEGLSASKLAGGLLVFSWLAAAATRPGTRAQLGALHPGIIYVGVVLLAWMAMSALWAEASGNALAQVTRLAPNLLLIPIVFAAVRRREDVWILVGTIVAATLLTAIYGALNPGDADSAAAGRLSGSGVDANYLASTVVAAIALVGGVVAAPRLPAPARILGLLAAILLLAALGATASRTGVVALVAALACSVLVIGPGRRAAALFLAVVVLGIGATYVTVLAPPDVREHVTASDNGTGREDIWTVGLRMAKANPIVGVGSGNYYISAVDYLLEPGSIRRSDLIVDTPKVAHNIYLELWAEIGIVGLLLFMTILGYALVCARRAARTFAAIGDRQMERVALGIFIAMTAMLAAAFFNSIEYQKSLWLVFSLGPAVYGLALRQKRALDV